MFKCRPECNCAWLDILWVGKKIKNLFLLLIIFICLLSFPPTYFLSLCCLEMMDKKWIRHCFKQLVLFTREINK